MKLADAHMLATALMAEHGLPAKGWQFDFDRAVRRFGCCHYTDKKITLSRALVELNDERHVRNTILHEIAHALAPAREGHGKVWKRIAVEIGATGNRTYSTEVVKPPRPSRARHYVHGHCPNCTTRLIRTRRANIACAACCRKYNGGRYTDDYKIIWR